MLNLLLLRSLSNKLRIRLRSDSDGMGISSTRRISRALIMVPVKDIHSLSHSRKRHETLEHVELGLAKLSLVIVFIFVTCHSFTVVPNIYELLFSLSEDGEMQSTWIRSFIHFGNFSIVLCSSLNFYVYCLTHVNIIERIKCYKRDSGKSLTWREKRNSRESC